MLRESSRDVRLLTIRAVLGRVALAIAAGIVLGIAGGLYFAQFLDVFFYEIEPLSVSSLALPVPGLVSVALLASWSPVRRAARVDPAEALSHGVEMGSVTIVIEHHVSNTSRTEARAP